MSWGTDRLDRMIAGTHERSPSGTYMMLPMVAEYREGYVKCRHRIDARFLNSQGMIFGGYVSALLDDVTGHAAMTLLPDDKMCATAELAVSYFRPCLPDEDEFLIEAFVINQTRRSYHIEGTLRRPDGKLVAKAHAVYAVSDRR